MKSAQEVKESVARSLFHPRKAPHTVLRRPRIRAIFVFGFALVSMNVVDGAWFAAPAQAFPASLLPSSGAFFGSRVAPRGNESERQAIERVEAQIGRQFAIDHKYSKWNESIPTSQERWDASTGRIPFLNWYAGTSSGGVVTWASIADGSQDAWIERRADAFRSFASPIYLAFHHEPENDTARFGSPADYAAAFRHIVDVFRARDVTNVAFVWDMTAFSFANSNADAFYPGDDVVDIVAADGYNWAPGRSGSVWTSFQDIFDNANAFATAHAKPLFVGETGAQEDPSQPGRKAQWILDMLTTAESWPQLKAVLYFDADKQFPWVTDSSQSSMDAYRQVAQDPYMNGGGATPPPPPPPPPPSDTTVSNGLNAGPQGAPITARRGGQSGNGFDAVSTTNGATLTYDHRHARGRFAAKHVLFPGGDAYYEWDGMRTVWYGRVFVWLDALPTGGLRLIRAATDGTLNCALDISRSGILHFEDSGNRSVVATSRSIARRRWVRIEWKVNHANGTVVIKLFNRANSIRPTEVIRAVGASIGASVNQVQFGRSGEQNSYIRFWTDDPGLSSTGYLGSG